MNGAWMVTAGDAFDDFRWHIGCVTSRMPRVCWSAQTSQGLRYERLGQFSDALGRNSSFDVSKADPSPPPTGSLLGYLVASNFKGILPAGVGQVDNTFGNYGRGQNGIAPRLGVAWQPVPDDGRLLVRGGSGVYYSRPTGQALFENVFGLPFASPRFRTGPANAAATFQAPFAQPFPTAQSFPVFPAYGLGTATSIAAVAPDFRPPVYQQYSVSVQMEPRQGWLIETGYVGTRGMHLQRLRSLNQALQASLDNSIRGVTTNTVANIAARVPIAGIPADSLRELESAGRSKYQGLEISLTKRLNRGLQFLASYTLSRTLDTDGADVNGTAATNGLTRGDQNSPDQRWGRASFDRTHRFIFSANWLMPSPSGGPARAVLGSWALDGVATIQSGTALTIAVTNTLNVFGISADRAQLTGTCTSGEFLTTGSVQSRLNRYFNTSCFTVPPVIGDDGIGTAFGNSATGIVNGPGQSNVDLALSKEIPIAWPRQSARLKIRVEFFNALNHPQFSNPDSNVTSPTFGVISSVAVSPRVGQLALKVLF